MFDEKLSSTVTPESVIILSDTANEELVADDINRRMTSTGTGHAKVEPKQDGSLESGLGHGIESDAGTEACPIV